MMDVRKRAWIGLCAAIMLVGLAGTAEAFYIDGKKTLSFTAKAQTRATFRLQDADTGDTGFTQPAVETGDLVQWRNLALLEIDHDLKQLTKSLDILYPLKRWKIRSKYHIVGRFMYEALYNVGSDKFKAVRDGDQENIDNFKQQYDLWEAYVDFSKGPAFVRIGRQVLAWGETDIFRLLDKINPLDDSFGGPFEDLDDRRIPLWMLRGSWNFGTVGPVASLTVEGFWVPGQWDVRVTPWAPWGTPYEVPLDKAGVYDLSYVHTPEKSMANSRWGTRIQGMLGSAFNFSLAYFETYKDAPTSHIILTEPVVGPLTDTSLLQIYLDYPKMQVVGGSFNFWESVTDFVFRGEVAYFIREPVNTHGISDLPFYAPVSPLPNPILDVLALGGTDLRSLGIYGIPVSPQSGPIPVKDSLNWMIGFDKQLWIRALNKRSMFLILGQYFGRWYVDWQKEMFTAVPLGDQWLPSPINEITGEPIRDLTHYPDVKEISSIFTMVINTNYMSGKLNPQLAIAYDTVGAWLFLPSVMYIMEPFRISLQYGGIIGQFDSFGLFRDRDQISINFAYLLN